MNNEVSTVEVTENPQPDWSLLMFWEDITALVQKLFEFLKSIF